MRILLLLIALFCYSSVSFSAAIDRALDRLNGEFSFSEGNILNAELNTQSGHLDNFLHKKTDKEETNYLKLSPDVFFQTQTTDQLFQIQVKADMLAFDDFSDDNHINRSIFSKYYLGLADNKRIFLSGYLEDEYEYRGTVLSLAEPYSVEEGDMKRDGFFNVGYSFGHEESLATAEVIMGYRSFNYLTRKDFTEPLKYSTNYIQGEFDYLITGKTYFSTKVNYEDISYTMNPDLERKQYVALAGIRWISTDVTEMRVLLGFVRSIFNTDTFSIKDRFAWQAKILWKPVNRFRVELTSGSEIKDSFSIIKSIKVSQYLNLGFGYVFKDKLIFGINGSIVDEEVVDSIRTTTENHFVANALIQYRFRDWFSVYTKVKYNTFDSTRIDHNYDLTNYSVGLIVSY